MGEMGISVLASATTNDDGWTTGPLTVVMWVAASVGIAWLAVLALWGLGCLLDRRWRK